MKTYSELVSLPTFEERFFFLQDGIVHGVGDQTFGYLRYMNQIFYRSKRWKVTRAGIIVRDEGCDLGILQRPIPNESLIRVHHINPVTPEMFDIDDPALYDPENLITTLFRTHQLLSYGGEPPSEIPYIERKPYDHCGWRKGENNARR